MVAQTKRSSNRITWKSLGPNSAGPSAADLLKSARWQNLHDLVKKLAGLSGLTYTHHVRDGFTQCIDLNFKEIARLGDLDALQQWIDTHLDVWSRIKVALPADQFVLYMQGSFIVRQRTDPRTPDRELARFSSLDDLVLYFEKEPLHG